MESGKGMRAVCLMVMIMLGAFAAQTEAFSAACYAGCFVTCTIVSRSPLKCGVKCLAKCHKPRDDSLEANRRYQCELNCANSKCASISISAKDPREKEVEGCVNNCSNDCVKA